MICPTDLYDGVGEPWAGQARLNGRADFSVKTNPELFSENFGADPPTGSEIYIVGRQTKRLCGDRLSLS